MMAAPDPRWRSLATAPQIAESTTSGSSSPAVQPTVGSTHLVPSLTCQDQLGDIAPLPGATANPTVPRSPLTTPQQAILHGRSSDPISYGPVNPSSVITNPYPSIPSSSKVETPISAASRREGLAYTHVVDDAVSRPHDSAGHSSPSRADPRAQNDISMPLPPPMTSRNPTREYSTTPIRSLSPADSRPDLLPLVQLPSTSHPGFVPTRAPPYTAPPDVVYPSDHISNPHVGRGALQPVLDNLPPAALYRPAVLPSDIDDRIDLTSVWMGVERSKGRAIYFLPATCGCCNRREVAQHCDRGWPECGRCLTKGIRCIPGKTWTVMKPKLKRQKHKTPAAEPSTSHEVVPNGGAIDQTITVEEDGGRKYSTEEKGKGRATDLDVSDNNRSFEVDEVEGRAKRVRKKRRLSAAGEIDPNDLNDDGSVNKKARRKFSLLTNSHMKETPLTADDRAYFARLDDNARRPPLLDMKGFCPIWSKTRRALQSAAEYLRQPVKTVGASVEIGVSGVARGVILEGQTPQQGSFWGSGRQAGTIITSIGASRPRFTASAVEKPSLHMAERRHTPWPNDGARPPSSSSPSSNNFVSGADDNLSQRPTANGDSRPHVPSTMNKGTVEASEIEALLQAQRSRTPIAIAIAQDYSAASFKVPRPFVVLGWFWVTEAWVEPDFASSSWRPLTTGIPQESVRWKFRFEWCSVDQLSPWWSPASDPDRVEPQSASNTTEQAWITKGTGTGGSTTVNRGYGFDRLQSQLEPASPHDGRYRCPMCSGSSEKVYSQGDLCLNEACPWFFIDASRSDKRMGPPNMSPSPVTALHRIEPKSLGLRLRPPEPVYNGAEVSRANAGQDFWRGWVCHACGLANERRKWKEWDCEACGRSICPQRRSYSDEQLRSASRPVCTGPRQDDGFPSWPFPATRSWTLFADDVKVIKHGLEVAFGACVQVYHALNSEGRAAHITARTVLQDLQLQGRSEVPFRRHVQQTGTRRPAEAYLSAFYTYACGGDRVPTLDCFPCDLPVAWSRAPRSCLNAVDLINERATRMFPGEQERFNSLLIAAFPPQLLASLQPRIKIHPDSFVAFLYLGSDGAMRFRRGNGASGGPSKQGEITVQHGDVVGVKTGPEGLDILPKLDGFGFICIARQAYQSLTAFPVRGDGSGSSTFGSPPTSHVPLPKASRPRGSLVSRPVPKTVKLPPAPLMEWYIGTRPLDPKQPLRVQPALRELYQTDVPASSFQPGIGDSVEGASESRWTSMVVLPNDLPPPTILAPPALDTPNRRKKLDDQDSPRQSKKAKTKRANDNITRVLSNTPGVVDLASDGVMMKEALTDLDSSIGKRGGRGGGGGGGRGRGVGRGRGGRKSLGDTTGVM